ncbi:MAG: alpha-1,4-glucan--maltose-1-phosphate maltosyltransferase [Thermoleophilaceae bacterium]
MPEKTRRQPPPRIEIQYPAPAVDDGRYAAKRCVGDSVTVSADIFRDGHDKLRAVVRYRGPGGSRWRESELRPIDAHLDGVRWAGEFQVDAKGRWEYSIQAWTDVFGTWRDELQRKVSAGQHDLSGELSEGLLLLEDAASRAKSKPDKALIEHAVQTLKDPKTPESAQHDTALGEELFGAVERNAERHGARDLDHPLALEVDRVRARFGAWYELFPRSWGGLAGVQKALPKLADAGFDVVYLPPIHPIGKTNRKGRNNALVAGAKDPGSPWAIGDKSGGHDAVHKDLGTLDDLRALTAAAEKRGIDIGLDFAIQASADHPWLKEHPDWFNRRPDGTLKYAENPPKRYQDIYNFNWESEDWEGLWNALRDVVLHWVDAGVKVFRVDNPHTKPFPFWEWLIKEVHARDRDVIFLAEAFTRRAVMRQLAKLGFTQSYTYFTWKNSRWELMEYVLELAYSGEQDYFRPNFFANTPDILHEYLQHGGEAAFVSRLVLAATLSPSYGIYSGYESFENVPVREGSEEYVDSEKYEIKKRKLDGPLVPLITRLNEIRRASPSLQRLSNITFLDTENDALMAYAKQAPGETIIVVVNLDPHNAQEGVAVVPAHLGVAPAFTVRDELNGEEYDWRLGRNYVRLDPSGRQVHVFRVVQ